MTVEEKLFAEFPPGCHPGPPRKDGTTPRPPEDPKNPKNAENRQKRGFPGFSTICPTTPHGPQKTEKMAKNGSKNVIFLEARAALGGIFSRVLIGKGPAPVPYSPPFTRSRIPPPRGGVFLEPFLRNMNFG